MKKFIPLLMVLGLVVVGLIWFGSRTASPINPRPGTGGVVCTMEAKICPDGSAVGRTGPKCEFATCPVQSPGAIIPGQISGHVNIGPFCPVERAGVPCPVPPEAYSSRAAIIYAADGVTIKARQGLDAGGNYQISLPAGSYLVQISPAGIGPGEKRGVTVKSGATSVANFDIDTGIR